MNMDEDNDRHGYSQPTLAQYDAMRERAMKAELTISRIEDLANQWENSTTWDYSHQAIDRAFGRVLRAALENPPYVKKVEAS